MPAVKTADATVGEEGKGGGGGNREGEKGGSREDWEGEGKGRGRVPTVKTANVTVRRNFPRSVS